jgi:CheY-like chemotaxis protein
LSAGASDNGRATTAEGDPAVDAAWSRVVVVDDDDDTIVRDDQVLLVVLSDAGLRESAVHLGRAHGFKVITTADPDQALLAARQRRPVGILVGMDLSGRGGASLLQTLKDDSETRHVPTIAVHASGAPDDPHTGRLLGALQTLEAPVSTDTLDVALSQLGDYVARRTRSLLVVSNDSVEETSAVVALFGTVSDVDLQVATSVTDALAALDARPFDCVVIDLKLPGGTGFDILKHMRSRAPLRAIPVVVSSGESMTKRDETRIGQYARSMVLTAAASAGNLIDQIALFLHRSDVEGTSQAETGALRTDDSFVGKRILVVDDDARNVFALTSALEQHGIDVVYAEHGEAGIRALTEDPSIDLVLMDVMMPGMDGYTAMREIRKIPAFENLPLISLTAKAMPGDRANSLSAGASDYVTKPVDVAHLLDLFRRWLT